MGAGGSGTAEALPPPLLSRLGSLDIIRHLCRHCVGSDVRGHGVAVALAAHFRASWVRKESAAICAQLGLGGRGDALLLLGVVHGGLSVEGTRGFTRGSRGAAGGRGISERSTEV